jgi:hypothetical protein
MSVCQRDPAPVGVRAKLQSEPYRKSAMPLSLRCYTALDGRDVIREWYDAQDGIIQGDFLGVIEILENVNRARADVTLFLQKRASSKCLGFHEILIDRDRRHYRVIGWLEGDVFTMLYPFYKNVEPRYTVPCEQSLNRKTEIEYDRRRSRQCEFPPRHEGEATC